MSRLVIALVLIGLAAGVALVLRRRRPEPPTQGRWAIPRQLDRRDFERPEAPWLLAVFTSATCASCQGALAKAAPLASEDLVLQEVLYQTRKDLHDRYVIETVPLLVLADGEGVVRASFVGAPSATDLWAAVADARNPPVS